MKRFFSLALALLFTVSMISVSALAVTTTDIDKKSLPNKDITISGDDFFNACEGDTGSIEKITIETTPIPTIGTLYFEGEAIDNYLEIPVASFGSLTFTPAANYKLTTSFNWTATENNIKSSPSSVNLDYTVEPPQVSDQTIKIVKNATYDGMFSATDPQDLPLTYRVISGPSNGDIQYSVSKGTFTYTPDKDFTGNDVITFNAANAYETSANATVTFIVGDITAPVAADMSVEVDKDGSVSDTLKGTDTNENPQDLVYSIVTQPKKGTVMLDADTGAFTYTHNTDKLVRDTFTYKVNNGYLDSNIATVTITINMPAPLAYRDLLDHWARTSAGTLGVLDLAIGEQIQNMYYYHPNRSLTRAEYALFLNSIMEIPLSATPTSVFADVTEPHLIPALNAAYANGVTAGTEDDDKLYFYPHKAITRIEAMKMLDNAMKFVYENKQPLTFKDSSLVPYWAKEAVQNLVGYKIVAGSDGYLRPLDLMTRAEAAQMLYMAYLERKS